MQPLKLRLNHSCFVLGNSPLVSMEKWVKEWEVRGKESGANKILPWGKLEGDQKWVLSFTLNSWTSLVSHRAELRCQGERRGGACTWARAGPTLFCFFLTDFLSLFQSNLPQVWRKLYNFFFFTPFYPTIDENKPISIVYTEGLQ